MQSHFNVLSSTMDSVTSALHTHFPLHSSSAMTTYPLPSFPASTHEILLTTLLTKKPPPETFDLVWSALQAPAVDVRVEALWGSAAKIVGDVQDSREWVDVVVTNEEREGGTVNEDEWVVDEGEDDEGEKERKKRMDAEMEVLLAVLRFGETGIPAGEQVPLPKVQAVRGAR